MEDSFIITWSKIIMAKHIFLKFNAAIVFLPNSNIINIWTRKRLVLVLKTVRFRIILFKFKGFFLLKNGKLPHRAIEVLPTPASPSIINLNLWSYCLFIVILDSMRWFLSDFFFHDIILFFSFSLEAHHFNSSKNTEYSWYRGVGGGGHQKSS